MTLINKVKNNHYIISLTMLFIASIVLNEVAKTSMTTIILMITLTIFAGVHIFKKAVIDIKYKIIGIDLLVTIAVFAALIIGDYFEGAAVTYLFTLGHFLEKRSLEKTRRALSALIDLTPTQARLYKNNTETMILASNIIKDDVLIVKPGEKIPTDGIILEGVVSIDEQMMTGESMPVDKQKNDVVFGSTILKTGYIKMRATNVGEDTVLSKIIFMVEEAQDKKASTQKFMAVFSKYYTPGIVLFAILIFGFTQDIRLAITMLVISCPGALVIATPVSFVAGIGNGAKKGILFKGGDSIERLAKGNIIFFDKTGTLTEGKPKLQKIVTYHGSDDALLKIAAIGESYSEHPLSIAIIEAATEKGISLSEKPNNVDMLIGKGIEFGYNGSRYLIGNQKMMTLALSDKVINDIKELEQVGMTTLIMSDEQNILGLFGIADSIRTGSKALIKDLKQMGFKQTIMLTGDQSLVAKNISDDIGLDKYYAGLMPEDKANIIKSYQDKYHTIFVGDGINDAVALTYADASVAIGGLGKDLAMETADVVLMSEHIHKLKDAIKISRKVKMNMVQNISFALLVVLFLIIGVIFKQVTMSIGMLVHELSVLIVLINATRLLRYDMGGLNEQKRISKQLYKDGANI